MRRCSSETRQVGTVRLQTFVLDELTANTAQCSQDSTSRLDSGAHRPTDHTCSALAPLATSSTQCCSAFAFLLYEPSLVFSTRAEHGLMRRRLFSAARSRLLHELHGRCTRSTPELRNNAAEDHRRNTQARKQARTTDRIGAAAERQRALSRIISSCASRSFRSASERNATCTTEGGHCAAALALVRAHTTEPSKPTSHDDARRLTHGYGAATPKQTCSERKGPHRPRDQTTLTYCVL